MNNQKFKTIKAAQMLDVNSGEIVNNVSILIEDNQIKKVVQGKFTPIGETIDLGGYTLLPGLIDTHTHLTFEFYTDWLHTLVDETAADWALRGASNAKKTLLAGFTTVRDMTARGFSDVSLMKAVERGYIDGPTIIPCGHPINITGGPADMFGFSPGILESNPLFGVADSIADMIKAVRLQVKHGAKLIKIYATGDVLSFAKKAGAQHLTEKEMKAIVIEAERHGLKVAAHAHGTDGIIAAINAGVHSIEHGSILNEKAVDKLKENDTYLIPQLHLHEAMDISNLPKQIRNKAEYITPKVFKSFKMALDADVKMAFGTDAGVFPHGENAKEFSAQVKYGKKPIEAIRGATIYAADLLGLSNKGDIKSNFDADIIAVKGNPLVNIKILQNVKFVMKKGIVYKKNTNT